MRTGRPVLTVLTVLTQTALYRFRLQREPRVALEAIRREAEERGEQVHIEVVDGVSCGGNGSTSCVVVFEVVIKEVYQRQ